MSLKNSVILDLVSENPRRTSVFEEHDIDYCRAGQRSLSGLCLEMGLNVEQIEAQLLACERNPFEHMEYALREQSLASLADYMENVCHRELRTKVMRISRLLARVALVYAKCNPELAHVRSVFEELRADLQSHMQKEEQIYFAWIREQEQGTAAPEPEAFELAQAEHRELTNGFGVLRELTDNYNVPDYACGSFRVVFAELAQLEADVERFVGIEDNVLFRRAAIQAAQQVHEPTGGMTV